MPVICFVEKRELRRLKKELRITKKNALAEGTTKNILVQWKAFNEFCDKFNLHEWPSSTDTLCLFAQHLARRMRSVKTVEAYLYGAIQMHLYARVSAPSLKDFQIKLTLRGIKRKLKYRVRQTKPLTPRLLLAIHQLLKPNNTNDTVFWAILITGYYLLLRKSNLVPDSQSSFDKMKHLSRKQVHVSQKYVKIKISWAKTIQFQERKLTLKMFRLKGSPLCPVKAFKKLFEVTSPGQNQSCFLDKNGKPFSYGMLNYRIKKYLCQAGAKKLSQIFFAFAA